MNISFIQNEIRNLAQQFDSVNVFTFKVDKEFEAPGNVFVFEVDYKGYSTLNVLFKNLFAFISIIFIELFKAPNYLLNLSKLKNVTSDLLRCFYLAGRLISEDKLEQDKSINYTFWFNQWATVLSILKRKNLIKNYVARAHGADLYEERVPIIKRIPFRWFQLRHVKTVFCVSNQGSKYLKDKYNMFSNKVQCAYLGTKDFGMGLLESQDTFTIVSCAHVRNIKRIHRIPEILQYINFPIHWIHIGSEHKTDPTVKLLHENVSRLTNEKSNVKVSFLGALSNDQIYEYYKRNYVNLFVSVSETEGLPVSMMEAISFGIPILSTEVGGCNEIVTTETGILFNKDFESKEVANLIEEEYRIKRFDKGSREVIRKFWESKFDSKKNMDYFMQFV